MSTVSTASSVTTSPRAIEQQSRLEKQVSSSNVTGVQKALKAGVTVDDLANAIRLSNTIVAKEVQGGTSGVRPAQVDALLRDKMNQLDSGNAVLTEVIAEGAKSANELQTIRDAALAQAKLASEARRPAFERTLAELAAAGEKLREQGRSIARPEDSADTRLQTKVLLELNNGRAPSSKEVADYNKALESARIVEVSIDGAVKSMDASRANATFFDVTYSRLAGQYTDHVNSIKVTVIE
jgi:hypothetical protein